MNTYQKMVIVILLAIHRRLCEREKDILIAQNLESLVKESAGEL